MALMGWKELKFVIRKLNIYLFCLGEKLSFIYLIQVYEYNYELLYVACTFNLVERVFSEIVAYYDLMEIK